MRKWIAALSIPALAVTFSAALAAEGGAKDAKALFEEKCSICHGLDRPTSKKKTAEEWTKTVMRMKNGNGCPITDDEAKAVVDYLAKNYGP